MLTFENFSGFRVTHGAQELGLRKNRNQAGGHQQPEGG